MKLLVDSWAWVELFRSGPKAEQCAEALSASSGVYTTVINVFEVCRRLRYDEGKASRDLGLSIMLKKAQVLGIDLSDALSADLIAYHDGLHAADAFTASLAARHGCSLLTGDPHFKGKPGVTYVGD